MTEPPVATPEQALPPPGAWSPLGVPAFRMLWIAILVGNIGTWLHDVAAAWTMAELTNSPLMVAAVQSATTLPVVLLALAAGTLADIVDRRRYLIVAQLWMLFAATALALLAQLGRLDAWSLLALTFALGVGAAMAMPAQAATTSELVPRRLLPPAVALNSISMNIARSIGPALGGVILAQFGAVWAFAINAASFLGVAIALWAWRRETTASALPAETFGSALRAGLRFAAHATVFRAVLVKAASFYVFAGALPALLPIVVRHDLGAGSGTYGLLLGCVGAGAVAGALLLQRLRAHVDRDRLVLIATVTYAGCMLAVASLSSIPLLCVAMVLNGFAWIAVLSSLQIAAQTSLPNWVRARALSLYMIVFAAGMAIGALTWGAVAQRFDTDHALVAAAVGALLAALATMRLRLGAAEAIDTAPSAHWPQPFVGTPIGNDRGPALVTIEYRIEAADREAFLALMRVLGRTRRRDGAVQWGVLEDVAEPGLHLEYFVVGSWLEHLRQHDRVTGEERRLQVEIYALHRGATRPVIRHFVGGTPGAVLPPHDHATHGSQP